MRLTETERKIILDSIAGVDKNARVFLYGSRTDDLKKGGDIDILIVSQLITRKELSKIRWKIYEKIGEQKIDFVISSGVQPAFRDMIIKEAIQL